MNNHASPTRVLTDYRNNLFRQELLNDWGTALVYRPCGLLIAAMLTRTAVAPSTLTAIGAGLLAVMLAASALLEAGPALAVVLLAAVAFQILDCADGPLARATGRVSVSGHYWDLVADLAYRGTAYAIAGHLSDQLFPWSLPVSQLAVLSFCAWLCVFARLARGELERLAPATDKATVPAFSIYGALSGLDTLFPLLAAAAIGFGALHAYFLWLFAYSLGDACVALWQARQRFKPALPPARAGSQKERPRSAKSPRSPRR